MRSPDRTRAQLALTAVFVVAAVALAGALAFGLWHVAVGWLLHGNPRAGIFGIVLSIVAAALLGGLVIGRRAARNRGQGG